MSGNVGPLLFFGSGSGVDRITDIRLIYRELDVVMELLRLLQQPEEEAQLSKERMREIREELTSRVSWLVMRLDSEHILKEEYRK